MGNDRETTQVIMSIQKAAMFMDPFFKLTMMGTAFFDYLSCTDGERGKDKSWGVQQCTGFYKSNGREIYNYKCTF